MGTNRIEVLCFELMTRNRMLKVLRLLITLDLVRQLADYESYSTFICFFLNEVLDRKHDAELEELCLETIIQ